ncbi:putative 37S ribosomal protein S26B, mitochondrial [Schizosaccharomyces pombe]|uniref:Small ribosomal subunit protein mS42 n=1 Tax=Schizosaccharomyces pombe (strain 972 / ATCC 24843) TaxID=284812 RepID=RT26_SCHPO|nr:putative mitochondrial ribosomal protein subunit S26 [Schizosaccharomyces pombe]O74379.1 RecName: Full=Small ribosomal subunit protein mS42; AltName: Full=37S ribosomal protein S26B, mitochondrial [Schizosaccharomyces pombe 972h-]CAA20300.1 mitochondrial ribosomal protein subunit S26 (predicted) [Schizosaccharomyces pombe]|eukprot:NP_595771.1 putative mitochondrial ribosomal protein subunit S26 [Schizosaccharomyces pombe]
MSFQQRFARALDVGYKNFLSKDAVRNIFAYDNHLRGLVQKECKIHQTPYRVPSDLMVQSASDPARANLFNYSSQLVNHDFFFSGLISPERPSADADLGAINLKPGIDASFGSFGELKSQMVDVGNSVFGDGWLWLVYSPEKSLFSLLCTYNASNAFLWGTGFPKFRTNAIVPLLCVNLWQYAYLDDYGLNGKKMYITKWWDMINWTVVNNRFQATRIESL